MTRPNAPLSKVLPFVEPTICNQMYTFRQRGLDLDVVNCRQLNRRRRLTREQWGGAKGQTHREVGAQSHGSYAEGEDSRVAV